MKIQKVKTYTFEELPEETQNKVIEKYYDINAGYYWEEVEKWNFEDKLKKLGYQVESKNIYWCGFSSQGDGASFEGSINIIDWIKNRKLSKKYRGLVKYLSTNGIDCTINIKTIGRYCHSYSMFVEVDNSDYEDKYEGITSEIATAVQAEARQLADEFYKELENKYDLITSEEVIKETLIDNEYYFTEDGEIWESQ